FLFSSRRRHTRFSRDWSSDVCSSDLTHQTRGSERPPCAGPPPDRRNQSRYSPFQGYRGIREASNWTSDADIPWHPEPGYGERTEIGRASCRERVQRSEGAE